MSLVDMNTFIRWGLVVGALYRVKGRQPPTTKSPTPNKKFIQKKIKIIQS